MMTAIAPEKTGISIEEYFELEWDSEIRNEYEDGKIIPMAYTTDNHMRLEKTILRLVDDCLESSYGEVFPSSKLIYVEDCNRSYYPDLSLFLEPEQHKVVMSGKMKAAINPTVIIEVLSESTEKRDRSIKRRCYQTLTSLSQYILVSQEEMLVEIYTRNAAGEWVHTEYIKPEAIIPVGHCRLKLSDIYRKVVFETGESASDGS